MFLCISILETNVKLQLIFQLISSIFFIIAQTDDNIRVITVEQEVFIMLLTNFAYSLPINFVGIFKNYYKYS